MHELRVSLFLLDFSCKHPVVGSFGREVFLPNPGRTFSWVSSSCPPPQLLENRMIHGVKGLAAGTEPMVMSPSSYDRVELHDDLSSRAILVFFDHPSDLL